MLIDHARIFVKAGNGGSGSMSFRREKFAPKGGPDGGDGGKGGDVILRVRTNLTSLIAFQYGVHFKAGSGGQGGGGHRNGKYGADYHIDVPPGTVVHDDETGEVIADLTEPNQTFVVAKGGKGGLGNSHFKSSIRQTPRIHELGEPGVETVVKLELRIIADIGIVGLPNAGKSTLLAASSAARPKIADYPFTTLQPNLGVVQLGGMGGQTYVLADVPGLIDGAAEGAGLGIEFLRHVRRTKALVHVVDASGGPEGRDPVVDFETINDELGDYDPELLERPMVVALNKTDIPEAALNLARLRAAAEELGHRVFEISAATGNGVQPLLNHVGEVLREIAARPPVAAPRVTKLYSLADDEHTYRVERTSEESFTVSGTWIERVTHMTNFNLIEGMERYQRTLEKTGISKELGRKGVKLGDRVSIADIELIWGEFDQLEAPEKKRRTAAERYAGRLSRAAD